MGSACITHEPIIVSDLEAEVTSEHNGAVCTFVGQVRNHSRGKNVQFLEYSAFVPLAENELTRIMQHAEVRWQVDVAIRHRIGRLEVGEASVVVCVGSRHRAEAFDACRWCIDTLKTTVPIWKRETCPDGTFWIEGDEAMPAETD